MAEWLGTWLATWGMPVRIRPGSLGDVAEWSMASALEADKPTGFRGFESRHPLLYGKEGHLA